MISKLILYFPKRMEKLFEDAQFLTDSQLISRIKNFKEENGNVTLTIEFAKRTIRLLKNEIDELKNEVKGLKKENESLKSHINASPDGKLYFQARDHYISLQEYQ